MVWPGPAVEIQGDRGSIGSGPDQLVEKRCGRVTETGGVTVSGAGRDHTTSNRFRMKARAGHEYRQFVRATPHHETGRPNGLVPVRCQIAEAEYRSICVNVSRGRGVVARLVLPV